MSDERIEDIPGSPIAGENAAATVGREVRRARASIEVTYRCEPGQFIDIQARIFDALDDVGIVCNPDLGNVLVDVDLTEHVRFR